jgi:hypothetical protein
LTVSQEEHWGQMTIGAQHQGMVLHIHHYIFSTTKVVKS